MESFKDFLIHILTITVGLLIAVGIEGGVERWHQRELREQAEQNLRREVQDNVRELANIQKTSAEETRMLKSVLGFLEARRAGKPYDIHEIQLGFALGALSDSSWKTASATGVLGLLKYERVQEFAAAYEVQEQLLRLQQATLDDFLQLQSYVIYGFDPDKVTQEDARLAEVDTRRALAHLVAVQQIGAGLSQEYGKVLQGK